MKHNNKKILSIMLTLCMVLNLLGGATVTANAAGEGSTSHTTRDVTLNLEEISDSNLQGATVSNGVYINSDEGWTWDTTNSTLTLDNCRIETTSGNGIELPETNINLVLRGENHIYAKDGSAITGCQNNTLTISGSGSLEAKADKQYSSVVSCGNLVLNSGTLDLVATSAIYMGISATDLTVNGGTLRAEDFYSFAIYVYSSGKIAINGGHVTVSGGKAIAGTNNMSVDSKLTIKGGDNAGSAMTYTDVTEISKVKYLDIAAPAAANFTDGFGGVVADAASYQKGKTTNNRAYVFAGWFDSTGKELTDVNAAESGETYTAKWKNNVSGKTVRTTMLDLTDMSTTDKSDDEGWSWNKENKTLTLSGATIDVSADSQAIVAVMLPADATITTGANTRNEVSNNATAGEGATGIMGMGTLTIEGDGGLSVIGKKGAILAYGNLIIKGSRVNTAVEDTDGMAISCYNGSIQLENMSVELPENYKIATSETEPKTTYIADGNGNAAKNVVIAKASAPTPSAGTLDFTNMESIDKTDTEGWKWDKNSKTLTLNKMMLEVEIPNAPVIKLPDGATIIATENTFNRVINNADNGCGIQGEGALTVQGAGMLNANGYTSGIFAKGLLTINAPIIANNAAQDGAAIISSVDIQIDSSLYIEQPANGEVARSEDKATISGNPVSIAKKTSGGGEITITLPAGGANVKPGDKVELTANVTDVTWSVSGNISKATMIDAKTGELTIGADETATEITVTATTNDGNTASIKLTVTKPIYTISGTVNKIQADGSTTEVVPNAKVELKKAGEDKAIDTKSTDASGKYSFADVPNGVYNIIVTTTDGQTMTKLIKVSGADQSSIDIILPKDKVSSVVTVEAGTPPVLVGGLEQVASKVKTDNAGATSVKVVMTVESKGKNEIAAETAKKIDAKALGQKLEYLDIVLQKTIDNSSADILDETANVLEIIVPYNMTGKNNITVYRYHGSSAEVFMKLSSLPADMEDGTYYLDEDNNLIHIFTKKFSTYAIGYNTSSGSSSGGSYVVRKPDITTGAGGKTELSADGTTATITPDVGYEIESVLLNGKDMGKVTKVTGLKTGDKVVITFKEIITPEYINEYVKGLKLIARSSKTTKGNILIKVTSLTDAAGNPANLDKFKDEGYTVKYKYYRSTKKSSEYGERLEKDYSINSYINTIGKKGTGYYYRVKVMVYDADGSLVANTGLKQCKYAARIWSK